MKRTALLIMLVTIISKVFGFIRELVLSYFYGASEISDAYIVAITVPNVIFALVGVGINNGYIPMYTKVENLQGTKKADLYTSNLTNIVLLITMIVFVVSLIFTNQLVYIFASGFSGDTLSYAVKFTRITLLGIFFTGLNYIYKGYLQIKGSFLISSLGGIPLNAIIILSIFFSSIWGLNILAIGFLVATISQFILILPDIKRKGYKHKLFVDFKDESIKQMLILVLPVILGSSVDQINLLIDRSLASGLAVGGISAINYANRLNQFVQGLFVISLVTVMYPTISKMAIKKEYKNLISTVSETISIISLVVVPITIITMIFSNEIITILFGRGQFDQVAIELTSEVLFFISLGMLSFSLRQVLTRVFYSLQDTKTPVINASIAMVLNIILNLILSKFMGIAGLALATSISVTVCTLLLGRALIKKLGEVDVYNFANRLIKIVLSTVIMGITVKIVFKVLVISLDYRVSIIISVLLGLIIYLIAVIIFRVIKLDDIRKLLKIN